jgi:DNA-binding NarL/FixJ family response regulator
MFFTAFAIIVCAVFIIAIWLKVNRLENKLLDVDASDVIIYAEQLREILSESERVAEKLDAAIREREGILEDLGSLIDARIARLRGIESPQNGEDVLKLLNQGRTKQEIARLLNMTVTEVEILSAMKIK